MQVNKNIYVIRSQGLGRSGCELQWGVSQSSERIDDGGDSGKDEQNRTKKNER